MTPLQKRIHEEALKRSGNYRDAEWPLIEILQAVAKQDVHRASGKANLFQYAFKTLKLSEPLSYAFTNIAVKATEIPALSKALRLGKFSVTKIIRITSVMTFENADELIALAEEATNAELDKKRAELNPGKKRRTSKKRINENESRLSFDASNQTLQLLARARELQTKQGEKTDDEIFQRVLSEWLDRHDPVRKAERAAAKKTQVSEEDFCVSKTSPATYTRVPLTAEERNAVNGRDRGQCTFHEKNGERCEHTKWVDIHHIVEVSKGGTNHPSNLRTLCWFHHDLIHQLSFPIEGQFSWIREPTLEYRTLN